MHIALPRLVLVASAILSSSCIAADRVGGAIAAVSDYVYRGVSATRGTGALQAELHYADPDGWAIGLWASNAKPSAIRPATIEVDASAGWGRTFNDWRTHIEVVRYEFPWLRQSFDYDYTEILGTVGFRDRVFATVGYSPDTQRVAYARLYRRGSALTYELSANWPLPGRFMASAGAGYYDLQDLFGTGYAYWNAGVSLDAGRWHWSLDYLDTDAEGRALFGESAGSRAVIALLWRF